MISFNRSPGGLTPLHSQWTLDGAGNWQQVDGELRQHSSFNEITQRSAGGVTAILSDDNGNETEDGRHAYRYDAFNRLVRATPLGDHNRDGAVRVDDLMTATKGFGCQVDNPCYDPRYDLDRDGDIDIGDVQGTAAHWRETWAVYAYDAFGRRIAKQAPDATLTRYLYDGWQVVEEQNDTDALVQQYVYGRDVEQTVSAPGDNGGVDFGGDDVTRLGDVSTHDNPYLHAGRRFDGETGLYYYRQRYLNAEQGRFIERDPIGVWTDSGNLGNGYTLFKRHSGRTHWPPVGSRSWGKMSRLTLLRGAPTISHQALASFQVLARRARLLVES